MPTVSLAEDPAGPATVESFTVGFSRQGPKTGIVVARNSQGERILALTRTDADTLNQLLDEDLIGRSGQVLVEDGVNIFEF